MTKTILFLCGGKSDEHEISLLSCKGILDALDRSRFSPLIVGISKTGIWHLEAEKNYFEGEFRADDIRLNLSAPEVTLAPFVTPDGRGALELSGRRITFDAVFPILHGKFGEDGTIQGLLDIVGIPYVGAGCGSSWICMDKVLTKTLCLSAGIAVTPFTWLANPQELGAKRTEIERLGFPLFVKPSRQGSSVGVSKVNSPSELASAIQYAFQYDSKVLIERGIVGRELECSVLGLNASPRASLPGEIIPSAKVGWYSYEAKYLMEDGAETRVPALLSPEKVREVQTLVDRVFQLLECDGMARIDLFLEETSGTLFLNEANTLPGFTPISMYPKMWQASGLSYSLLITELIDLAFQRAAREAKLVPPPKPT